SRWCAPPPGPPTATTTCSPSRTRSRSTLPRSLSYTTVPGGTWMTRSSALRPWQLAGSPRPPLSARQCLRLTISAKLSVPATARTMTSPPSPPSPPSGPPLGTYFSRRKLQQPDPPSPPLTKMLTRSTNAMTDHLGSFVALVPSSYHRTSSGARGGAKIHEPNGIGGRRFWLTRDFSRDKRTTISFDRMI